MDIVHFKFIVFSEVIHSFKDLITDSISFAPSSEDIQCLDEIGIPVWSAESKQGSHIGKSLLKSRMEWRRE